MHKNTEDCEQGGQELSRLHGRIAELEKELETLRESERRYRGLYRLMRLVSDNVPDLIWAKDMDDRFIFLNQAMCDKLLKCGGPDEAIGKSHMFFAELERERGYGHSFGEVCVNSDALTRDRKAPGRFLEDGLVRSEHLVLDVHKAPLFSEEGEMIGTVGCGRDVTKEKEIEGSLRRSEARYRAIVEDQTELISRFSPDGTLRFVNDAYCRYYGETREELVGRSFWHHMPEDDQKRLRVFLDSFDVGNRVSTIEHRVLDSRGKVRWLQWTDRAFFDEAGRIVEYQAVGRDISAKKFTEQALQESEERYRQLFELESDAIVLSDDTTDYILEVNAAAEALYGYKREELLLKKNSELSAQPEEFSAAVMKRWRHGSVQFHKKKDGTVFPVEITGSHFVWRGHRVSIAAVRDVTQRMRAEAALHESKVRLQTIYENSPIAIWEEDFSAVARRFEELRRSGVRDWRGYFEEHPERVTDFVGLVKILDINETAVRFFGANRKEEISFDLHAYFTDESLAVFREKLIVLAEGGTSFESEIPIRNLGGEEKELSLSLVVLPDSEEPLGRVLVSFSDITARKRAEEEKERLQAQLRQAQKMEAIGTLAGGIAHDFNNILAPIIGYTEMVLGETPESNPARHDLEQVLKAAGRARELVKQILAFSRYGSEQQRVPLEIGSIVKEALKLLRASLPATIEIQQRVEKSTALADATQVHQVLMNLCTNAAHAMNERGTLSVSLDSVDLTQKDSNALADRDLKPGPYLKLTVSDTGHGMDAATMQRIFDPYFTTKRVGSGSGLGLAVVHGIAKRHGGAVFVQSEVGKGSTFDFYLPRIEAKVRSGQPSSSVLPRGDEQILLVDDEQVVVNLGRSMLRQLGYSVVGKTSALDALEVFRRNPEAFDLVITDYTMPNLTGTDLAVEILEIRPDIPIILCTGYSEKVTEESARDLGITAFAVKPLDRRQMAQLVRSVLDVKPG